MRCTTRLERRPGQVLRTAIRSRIDPLESRTFLSGSGVDYTYTNNSDFDLGVLQNLNHSVVDNQLQVNPVPEPFPFINVACSGRGTIARIDTLSGQIIGEYWTAPTGRGHNPSRTTVDQFGNVWAGNRDEGDYSTNPGSVVKIGIIVGGTRYSKQPDGTYLANPTGQYVKDPLYSTCVDRDGDGYIKTSYGLGNILPWTNAGGTDTNGGVSTADDEAITIYKTLQGAGGVRHVSIDTQNNVWVGGFPGYSSSKFYKLDGVTGAIMDQFQVAGTALEGAGYGGLVDHNGVLWSSSLDYHDVLRYDTNTHTGTSISLGVRSYGMGIDSNGYIWVSNWEDNGITKIAPNGTIVFNHLWEGGVGNRGVAVTLKDNNVWIANSDSNTVSRLDNNGNILKVIGVGSTPTGVSVDSKGKVWVTNYGSSNTMRIDPDVNLGTVDLTVNLGGGANPYNYSDMTGAVAIGATNPQGTWTVNQDSGAAGTVWGKVAWNTENPAPQPGSIDVQVRAADQTSQLPGLPWLEVGNNIPFNSQNVIGRYIQVQAILQPGGGVSPALTDIHVMAVPAAPQALPFIINDGNAQRSKINAVTIRFDHPVQYNAAMVTLVRRITPLTGVVVDINPKTMAQDFTLTFSGSAVIGGSLPDGVYDLSVDKASIVDEFGQSLIASRTEAFHRLFGDSDGDKDVDNYDLGLMRLCANKMPTTIGYKWYFDFDGVLGIRSDDWLQATARVGKKLVY
jgi:hypothetical protein